MPQLTSNVARQMIVSPRVMAVSVGGNEWLAGQMAGRMALMSLKEGQVYTESMGLCVAKAADMGEDLPGYMMSLGELPEAYQPAWMADLAAR